ncbi:hypothetical protein PISL3812_07090 [Talaromyces islandicus]|uniref:Uncharacterized protein n=1 Tax=Talaromyces islandicus TaxID=28573 RepID=A0A0U1M396_TALIS|nr:hypothetical protein PISL3812_07090 [Talaromyces islandicus]
MADDNQRYRPLLFAIAGLAALGGLIYLRSNATAPPENTTKLRRRGAILRRNRRDVINSPSGRAIAHLEQLERENGAYGTFRIETEDGRMVESGLLPSLLATRDQLMADVGMPEAHADRMRDMMEDTFLESFFALDFPPSHTINEDSPEREYLIRELSHRGISRDGINRALANFNLDPAYGEALRLRRQQGTRVTLAANTAAQDIEELHPDIEDGAETESAFSWRNGNADGEPAREGQNLLNLLYHISEDQARKDGYIHRGVTCNNCGMIPIQGIRYRCDNCVDFDLCEVCEAQQVHNKTHLFLKVRIPAPYMGNPRQARPVWYPGKPDNLPKNLPPPLARRFVKETNFETTELDALWDQFRCLANATWTADPNKLGMAIDRKTFDRCFVPNTSSRPPPPSLIFDRMFAFYDTNGDNLIGFEEFLKGIASFNTKAIDEKMRRIFKGYDINGDGYVERKDFLRMFRAFYALIKELTADTVHGWEEDFGPGDGTLARDIVMGTRPLSSAFSGTFGNAETPRTGEGKRVNLDGDMEIADGGDILRPDGMDYGDIYSAVGEAAVRNRFRRDHDDRPLSTVRPQMSPPPPGFGDAEPEMDGGYEQPRVDGHEAEPEAGAEEMEEEHEEEDEEEDDDDEDDDGQASNGSSDIEVARRNAIHERWRRRNFYTDEEDGATAPEGFEDDSDVHESGDEAIENEQSSRPPSLRSRSSSKVRFEDDDFDVRSTGSTSVGERWGGFEVPEPERDVGKEILYQATKEGMNDLLDTLFKEKEDLLMEAHETRKERLRWAAEIESYLDPQKPIATSSPDPVGRTTGDKSLDELLNVTGYSVVTEEPSSAAISPENEDEEGRQENNVEEAEEIEEVDPTLPQNRPNEEITPVSTSYFRLQLDGLTTLPAPHLEHSNEAEFTAPKLSPALKPSPSNGSPIHRSPTLSPQRQQLSDTPSRRQLAYWARLNQVERESIERGGGAKLDYDEFRRIMNTEQGKKLSFISTYIEMASF